MKHQTQYNKSFCLVALLSFVFFYNNVSAVNDSLSIRQAFNWQIGDTLIYKSSIDFNHPPVVIVGYYDTRGIRVMSKSTNNDSITYLVQHLGEVDSILVTFDQIDSPIQTFRKTPQLYRLFSHGGLQGLDSSLPICGLDTVHHTNTNCMNSFYNDSSFGGRLTFNQDFSQFESGYEFTASENVGMRELLFGAYEMDICPQPAGMNCQGSNSVVLCYYSSGGNSWMDSVVYFYTAMEEVSKERLSLDVYPNPVTDQLFIRSIANDESNFVISDALGRQFLSGIVYNNSPINVAELPKGIYFINIESSVARFFKE